MSRILTWSVMETDADWDVHLYDRTVPVTAGDIDIDVEGLSHEQVIALMYQGFIFKEGSLEADEQASEDSNEESDDDVEAVASAGAERTLASFAELGDEQLAELAAATEDDKGE